MPVRMRFIPPDKLAEMDRAERARRWPSLVMASPTTRIGQRGLLIPPDYPRNPLVLDVNAKYLCLTTDLMRNEAIRDTLTHYPITLLDLRQATEWSFRVVNNHNQPATVNLIGFDSNVPQLANLLDSTGIVAGSASRAVVTDLWTPYLGIALSFVTAPTSGDASITGCTKKERG